MSKKYWIESIEFQSDTDSIGKIVLSCRDHGECIVILGTKQELTDRAILVLNGLNNPSCTLL